MAGRGRPWLGGPGPARRRCRAARSRRRRVAAASTFVARAAARHARGRRRGPARGGTGSLTRRRSPARAGCAGALERDQLAEHPVVLGRLLDRVGALQPRLQVGDPAHRGQLLQPVDVRGGVGRVGLLGRVSGSTASALTSACDGRVVATGRRAACATHDRPPAAAAGPPTRRPPPRRRGRSGG